MDTNHFLMPQMIESSGFKEKRWNVLYFSFDRGMERRKMQRRGHSCKELVLNEFKKNRFLAHP